MSMDVMTEAERHVFGRNLSRKMRAVGLRQYDLASLCRVDPTTVSGWVKGKWQPGAELMPIILSSLGCTLDELFGGGPIGESRDALHDRAAEVLSSHAFDRVEQDLKAALRGLEELRSAFRLQDPVANAAGEILKGVERDMRRGSESAGHAPPGKKPGADTGRQKAG